MNSITIATLSHLDPTFYEICCYQNGERPNFEMHDVFVLMTTFRRNLSFQWIESIREDLRVEMLTKVIITLLNLADDKNTTLRLAAYSTIGTLILSVAPYSPSSFISAFADAIPWMAVSSKISIAIINSFISLMRFISPVRINTYIERMPILHHFSADVSDFIQYLPITIPSMKKLPPEFLINILNSLISKCGNSPNGYFSTAISMLVNLKRKLLLPELSKRLIQKNYNISAVWIGRNLFADRKTYDIMSMEFKQFILNNAFEQLHCSPLDLSRFDYSCKIIATALRYELDRLIIAKMNPNSEIDENEEAIFYEQLQTKLKESLLDKYSSPFRNSLLILPTDNLDSLVDVKTESDSFRASKIAAITNYFFDYIQQQRFEQISKNDENSENNQRILLTETTKKSHKQDMKSQIRKCNSTRIGELIKPSSSSLDISPSMFNSNALLCINATDFCKGIADRVAEMLFLFVESRNDLFSTLLENLSLCMNELLIRCKKKIHITMLKKIFAKHNSMKLNWVQHTKLAQLIDNINPDLASRFIPDYLMTVTKILLDLTISPTDKLFRDSIDVLCNIASYETLPKILEIIKYSDWYTESIVYKRFYLLAKLAKLFKSDLFTTFVGIAYECLFFCEAKNTYSVIFWFLSKVNIDTIPDNVKEFAFTFVEKCYFSYAHQPIYKKSYVTDDFVEYDADIVTNPLIDHKTALSPLWHGYRFLCHISISMKNNGNIYGNGMITSSSAVTQSVSRSVSSLTSAAIAANGPNYQFPAKSANPSVAVLSGRNNMASSENLKINMTDSSTSLSPQPTFLLPQDMKRLYHYSIPLVKIFGRYALQMASKLAIGNKKFEQEVYDLSLSTFLETDDDKVAATCASIFINKRIPIRNDVREMLSQFIGGRFTDNLDLLFYCFSGVNMEDHKLAVESVPIVAQRQWLPVKTATLLLFKLIKLLGTDIIMSVSDENALAFLPLANQERRRNISTKKCQSNKIVPTTSSSNATNDVNNSNNSSNVSLTTSQTHGFSGENLVPQKKIEQDQDYQLSIKAVQFGQSDSVIYSADFYKEKVRKYISDHHFSDFPIDNDELKMSLLKFLRDEPRIVLTKSELLDTVHWKFIFENIDRFDISEVSNYIDGNPSVFAKIELSSYSLFSQSFTLLPLNSVPLFASITPFIAQKKHVPYNLSLFRSFALFSGQRINLKDEMYSKIFERMIVYAVKSRHVGTIKAIMEYSLRFKYEKFFIKVVKTHYVHHNDDEFKSNESMHFSNNPHVTNKNEEDQFSLTTSIFTNVEKNQHNLRNLKSYPSVVPGAIHSHKTYLTDKIFFTDELIELTAKIDPESVLYYLGLSKDDRTIIINNYQIVSDNLRAMVIMNIQNETKGEYMPDFYLDYFINTQIYKKKQYILLIKLLENVSFSIKKMSDLIIDILKDFKSFSDKKKHVFIRFITQALHSLSKYQTSSDFKSFMNCLVIQFPAIAMDSDASILLDFSYLFGLLAEYAADGSFFIDFINSVIGSATSIPPLYLISTSKLISKKVIPVLVVDPSLFTSILESDLPSLNCGVLRALSSSHVTNHISGMSNDYETFSSSFYGGVNPNEPKIVINNEIQAIVGEKLQSYKQSFLLTDFLPDFVNYATEINDKYTDIFLSDKNHPCFTRSLRCRKLTTTTLYNLFKLSFTTPEIIGSLVKFTYNKKYMNTQIIEYFRKFEETIVYSLLVNIQLSGVSDKIVNSLFSDLPSSFQNFLVLFCYLRRFYARSNQETKNKIKKLIELKADRMSPQSRFFSLMMLCEDSLKEVYLGFMVAAIESNDFSKIAQDYDKVIEGSET